MSSTPPGTSLADSDRCLASWQGRRTRDEHPRRLSSTDEILRKDSPVGYTAIGCHSWLLPLLGGHWMTLAPSAVEAPETSTHHPVWTLTIR